ncbi:MAG: hypothetical protein WAU39_19165 [Polyangiales bacterium]
MSPAVVALILAALWLAGVPRSRPDLRFSAPIVARPGKTIGLRAWQVVEGPRGQTEIETPEVEVVLRNDAGSTLAQTMLSKSLVQGSEGRLAIPDGLDDVLTLVARATIGGQEVAVERVLYVQRSIESRAERGRAVNAFQIAELGPIRVSSTRGRDAVLDPRVEEGACVPDLSCWLSVWVGSHEGRVRMVPLAGLPRRSSVETVHHGFARFPLTVAGSEARVEVELMNADGTLVAAREARLPVVPGGIVARSAVEDGSIRLEWHQLGAPAPVLIDVFEGDRWVNALSLGPAHPVFALPGPGVWRIQVRADLFSDNTAAVSYAVVPDPEGPGALRQAADAVLHEADREGLDPLAMAILDGEIPDAAAGDALRALFAIPSFDVVSTGPGVSARVGDDSSERGQDRRRWLAAAVILLIGLVVSTVLLRIEILARADAQRLFDALGDEAQTPPRRGPSGRGLWAFVLFVFVLMAALALSKRWF